MQNKYPATRFIWYNFDKKNGYWYQKVKKADEIKPDICKYLISFEVADDACYDYVYKFLPVQNKYPATRFICHSFDKKNGYL